QPASCLGGYGPDSVVDLKIRFPRIEAPLRKGSEISFGPKITGAAARFSAVRLAAIMELFGTSADRYLAWQVAASDHRIYPAYTGAIIQLCAPARSDSIGPVARPIPSVAG